MIQNRRKVEPCVLRYRRGNTEMREHAHTHTHTYGDAVIRYSRENTNTRFRVLDRREAYTV